MARRADPPTRAGGAPAGRDDRSRGRLLDRSVGRSASAPHRAVTWPARIRSGSSSTAKSRPIWASLVRVADLRPRRIGGDVHRRTTLSRRRARPPVLNSSCAPDPGRSSSIDWRQRAATASPARFRPS